MGSLIMLHCVANTGYAIAQHESVFFEAACLAEGDPSRVHFSYRGYGCDRPSTLPGDFNNLIEYDFGLNPAHQRRALRDYVGQHEIHRVLVFDLSPGNPLHRVLRSSGVGRIVAYHGAPMGTPTNSARLSVRKVRLLFQSRADHYVFQSYAMQATAIRGRGLSADHTSVVRSGLDVDRYRPGVATKDLLTERLGVPPGRFVVYYSGHMERRKGVQVIMRAASRIVNTMGVEDIHFLLVGDRPGEEAQYLDMIRGTEAAGHVTFGGYRHDLHEWMSACDIGVIATTGWDSFPRSSMEIGASGMPLIVSDIGGLPETIRAGKTGFIVPAGDDEALAARILELKNDPVLRARMGAEGRATAVKRFARERQIRELARVLAADQGLREEAREEAGGREGPATGQRLS